LTHLESDFINARTLGKAEILQIFGIPAGMYDKDATYANASAARQTFINDTLWPKLVRFTQKLTQHLAPFYGGNLVIEPDDVRDNAADLAEIEAAKGYLPVNEIRGRYFNLQPVAWGDKPTGQPAPTEPSVG